MQVGIVGCGICGAYLASKLSKEHEVLVFEQKHKIGKLACSGLISEMIWQFIPENKKLVQNKISTAIVHFPKKTIKLKFYPEMLVINHKELDQYVAGLAKKAGANILLDHKVEKVFLRDKPQLLVNKKTHEFDYLIGCDGPISIVRRSLELPEPSYRLGILTYTNEKNYSDFVDVWPLKSGFSWKIPRGNCTEYGVLGNPAIAKQEFSRFCKKEKIKPKKIYSALVPEGLITGKDRVALCGDAAGLTKPISGGGVIWALTTVDLLVKNFPNIKKYNYKLERFFAPKLLFSRLATKMAIWAGNHLPLLLPAEIEIDSDLLF